MIIGTTLVALHVIGFVLTFRAVYKKILDLFVDIYGSPLETRDLFWSFLGSWAIAVCWPITVPAYYLYKGLTYKIEPKRDDS